MVLGDSSAGEQTALLHKNASEKSVTTRLRHYAVQTVDKNRTDYVLLFGYIITGILDSSSALIWGTFVSMQTGNTIYFGIGLADPDGSTRWVRAAVSIGSFCLGGFVFAAVHRVAGKKDRWVLVSSYLAQSLLLFAAALMVTFGRSLDANRGVSIWNAIPLSVLAFQAAGQMVSSRALEYSSVSSLVLTSNYVDLFSDPNLLGSLTGNVDRNRRAAAPILLLIGVLIGGAFARSRYGLAGAIWFAVALKLLMIVAWLFWPAEKHEDGE